MVTAMNAGMRALALSVSALIGCGSEPAGGDVGDADGDSESRASGWETAISGLGGALLGVWGRVPGELWAVGVDARDGTGPIVIRGTADGGWARLDTRPVDPDGGHLWWAFGADTSATWIVGERGRVFRVVGDEVERVESGTDATLYGIWGASEDALWAVGGYVPPRSGRPTIVRLTKAGGTIVPLPDGLAASGTFFKVWGAADGDVWVVGDKGMVLRFDGTAWRRVAMDGEPRLVTIHGRSAGDLVAVGGSSHGLIFEGDGSVLAAAALEGAAPLNGVFVEPSGAAWAVGMLGEVRARAGAGSAWEAVRAEIPRRDWHAVWVDARGDVWMAGGDLLSRLDQGTLVRRGPARADLPSGAVRGLDPETAEVEAPDADDASEVIGDASEVTEVIEEVADSGDDSVDGDTTAMDGEIDDGPADAGPDADDAPDVIDAPVFELGALADDGDFVPFVDGVEVGMVHGPQGGFHLVVGAEFAWGSSDAEVPIGIALELEVDGGVVAASYPVTAYPAQRVGDDLYRTYELLVVFCDDPPPGECYIPSTDASPFDGARARLTGQIAPPGASWERTIEVVLRDTR